ncbi:hypothetical protein SAMN05428941_7799 [Streptomyces sp. 2114.2]|nr:hypothetical protein SAMN05428941_7799 [Streptomyces sp. 2114.2]
MSAYRRQRGCRRIRGPVPVMALLGRVNVPWRRNLQAHGRRSAKRTLRRAWPSSTSSSGKTLHPRLQSCCHRSQLLNESHDVVLAGQPTGLAGRLDLDVRRSWCAVRACAGCQGQHDLQPARPAVAGSGRARPHHHVHNVLERRDTRVCLVLPVAPSRAGEGRKGRLHGGSVHDHASCPLRHCLRRKARRRLPVSRRGNMARAERDRAGTIRGPLEQRSRRSSPRRRGLRPGALDRRRADRRGAWCGPWPARRRS